MGELSQFVLLVYCRIVREAHPQAIRLVDPVDEMGRRRSIWGSGLGFFIV